MYIENAGLQSKHAKIQYDEEKKKYFLSDIREESKGKILKIAIGQ